MGGAGIPKTPFFCVHGVGGNVFRLRELSQLLGRPFYGIQGWSDQKDISYLGSVDAMVSRYLEEIRKVQPTGPYLLGGICVGCHVAFEMARRLTVDGQTVAHMVFLDTQAGGQAEGALDFASLEAAVADELGIPVARQRLLALPPEGRLEYLVREGRRSQALPPGFTTADARRYIEVFRLNLHAWNEHRPTPWNVRATLLAGDGLEGDPSAGWNDYALGGCDFVEVTGDHATMLRSPHVEGLAAKLARVLDAEEARLGISRG
jgi:thioesterase domain-containing protein